MIWLAEELLFLCSLNVLYPTIFVSTDGDCVAMCENGLASGEDLHACFDSLGKPLTACFDERHRQQLCDAYIVEVNDDQWEMLP